MRPSSPPGHRRRNRRDVAESRSNAFAASSMDMDSNCGGSIRVPCDCSCLFCGSSSLPSALKGRSLKRKIVELKEEASSELAHMEIENEATTLREAIGSHQHSIQKLHSELEEERAAAATAAYEAMSMILRLQREKADAQMDARQFKGFAEEKMAHDQQEIALLQDLLFRRNQAIESFSCEIQAYRHRLLSVGISPPSIGCEFGDFPENVAAFPTAEPENKYAFGSPSFRMELGKNELSASVDLASDIGGGGRDDVGDTLNEVDDGADEAEMRRLCVRLQALEADRESMRQAILSMGTDKAQVLVLKEIAQQLCKEVMPERRAVKKPSFVGSFPLVSAIKSRLDFSSQPLEMNDFAKGQ